MYDEDVDEYIDKIYRNRDRRRNPWEVDERIKPILEKLHKCDIEEVDTLESCAGYDYPFHNTKFVSKKTGEEREFSPYIMIQPRSRRQENFLKEKIFKGTDWENPEYFKDDPDGLFMAQPKTNSRKRRREQWDLLEQNIDEYL
jgi:hypothetical protein